MDTEDTDDGLFKKALLAVAPSLKLENILAASRDEMFEQFCEVTSADVVLCIDLLCLVRASCECQQTEEECGRCVTCKTVTTKLATNAACLTAAFARWNALHPDLEPLGNAENLAKVDKIIRDAAGNS